jgi:DNA-binding response OmpR family regulator
MLSLAKEQVMMNDTHGLILLVEDNSVQRRLYSDVLITQGYTVFAAENVKEAEQFLLSNMPSLIILDIMMPEIDGIEACQRFRKTLGERIPILFLTAADTMDVVLAAMKAGGDDYIVKSGSSASLIDRVKHWRHANHVDLPERRSKVLAYLRARANPETAAKAAPGPAHLHSNAGVVSTKR